MIVAIPLTSSERYSENSLRTQNIEPSNKYSDTNCVNPGALLNGCTSTKERILGGRRVNEGEIPWQVMFRLRVQDLFLSTCGGTIISNQFVLTAAHCFIYPKGVNTSTNTRLNESYIMAGSTKFNTIVQVSNPFVFGENVMALCLPKVGLSIPEGSTLIVSGWGVTSLHPSYKTFPYFSQTNMRTELKTLSMESEKCEYSKNYPVSPNSKMCTYNPPHDSCIGDSGSPLTMAIDGQCILVGIVSEGKDCGSDQYGALSVNVSHYTTWILKQIKENSYTNCVKPGALLNGCTSTKERILGGRRVNEGEIPWQVQFQLRKEDFSKSACGGTIISHQFVLTAAHCFIYPKGVNTSTNTRLKDSYIMAGSTKFNSGEKHTIKKLIVHPEYSWNVGFLLKNDIAIVQVSNPFVFGENVMALCLPKVGLSIPEGSTLIVSGWGVTSLHPSYKTFS
ncbi:TMPRSS9 [Lepeophtheirus salmonis]|uniref:TMPRSS9 n=1 Tax=Lepeophtheirus salmonis TaxID=72036 RepID=A0A7R8CKU2_LEPSM|nr:TMPRSS9 [Lepeophtheirus salmonis]CAF2807376.1 TMPRSS9 [Lepeophtheirus salmonis]